MVEVCVRISLNSFTQWKREGVEPFLLKSASQASVFPTWWNSEALFSLDRATSFSEVNGFPTTLATFASNNIASANELESPMKAWQPEQRRAISLGAPYHFICAHTCRYACMHGCPQAQPWLSPTPCLNIWMSELFNRGRQQQGQREHLGRPPWGEWVCSSVERLTHFIISLSHTPRIHCMHEQAKAIVKQAHVRTRLGATGGETLGQCAIFTLISVLDKNGCMKLILHL